MTAGIYPADQISHAEIDAIVAGAHHDPHAVLGGHPGQDSVTIRALRPLAENVTVVLPGGSRVPMRHVHEGVFSAVTPGTTVPDYRLAVTYPGTGETISDDPYRHLPTLGEIDLHLIAEGRHEALWTVLGARVRPEAGGTSFAVWAPNARGVRVIGDFNHWDGRAHPMRSLGASGVWELLIPGVGDQKRLELLKRFEKALLRGRDMNFQFRPFMTFSWLFETTNSTSYLDEGLSAETRKRFTCDVFDINWHHYTYLYSYGMIKFIMKDERKLDQPQVPLSGAQIFHRASL